MAVTLYLLVFFQLGVVGVTQFLHHRLDVISGVLTELSTPVLQLVDDVVRFLQSLIQVPDLLHNTNIYTE